MTTDIASNTTQPSVTVHGPLYCALTGRVLAAEEAYWAAPLITARELVSTFVSTLLRAPANLGVIMTAEQPEVPYAPEVRELLAQRRSTEQAKLLFLLLLLAALIFTPVLLLAMR